MAKTARRAEKGNPHLEWALHRAAVSSICLNFSLRPLSKHEDLISDCVYDEVLEPIGAAHSSAWSSMELDLKSEA
jgi:hypothetical protein